MTVSLSWEIILPIIQLVVFIVTVAVAAKTAKDRLDSIEDKLRGLTEMEAKVNMMWAAFQRRFGTDEDTEKFFRGR